MTKEQAYADHLACVIELGERRGFRRRKLFSTCITVTDTIPDTIRVVMTDQALACKTRYPL